MDQPVYKAVFFDLDGTLLPMDVGPFLQRYFDTLAKSAVQWGFEPREFSDAVRIAVSGMASHAPHVLNSAAFWVKFDQLLGGIGQRERDFFDDFYTNAFGTIGEGVVANPAAAHAVNTLREKGYPLYLTTMPMFPREGVEWRLRWSQVDPGAFSRITCYDNSTATKPSLEFFRENLAIAGVPAENVLMVGNNTNEDLACLDAGMDAYLVTDHLLNPNDFDIETVKHGSLQEFAAFADGLPRCEGARAACENANRAPETALSERESVDAVRASSPDAAGAAEFFTKAAQG